MIRRVLIVLSMVAAVVGAEENTGVERARQLFLQAQTRYQAGEYAQAAALFDQSHAALPRIELVYNAGLSYLWAADCENARSRFETYVAGVSAVRDHSRVQQAVQSMRGRSDTVGSDPLCALVARLRLAISIAEGGSSSDTTAAEDAQRFFQIAQQRYRQRNYREAARFMLIAHEILPIPALAYNVGVCYQWSVDYDAARDWFRRYITGKSEIAGCPEVQTANRALEGAGRTTSQLYCQRISDLKRAIARCDNDTSTTEVSEAKQSFLLAKQRYEARNYSEAASLMECSYAILPIPELAYNVGMSQLRAGNYRSSLVGFTRYLEAHREYREDERVAAAIDALNREPELEGDRANTLLTALVRAIGQAEADRPRSQ